MPEITAVVPTFRRPDLLRRCLASLGAQEVEPDRIEVVVVDDGSGDATGDVLRDATRAHANVRAISFESNRGPAAARNRAVSEASSRLILFLDDDVVAPPDLVTTHLNLHSAAGDPMIGILGRVDWHPDLRVTLFMRWLDRSGLQFGYDTWLREGPVDPPYAAFYTANLSMSRDLVLEAGGFDERFPYPAYEDMELAWRLTQRGFRMEYRPDALAYHARAIDLPTFRARMAKVAESAALLRSVQPDFPLDETDPVSGWARRRDRLLLRLVAPLAAALGRTAVLDRHYRAEIAAAYEEGRERAKRTLAGHAA